MLHDLYPIRQNNKEGYIDADGKIVIKPQFEFADIFSRDTACVAMILDNTTPIKTLLSDYYPPTWGYIDCYGRWAAEPKFDHDVSFPPEKSIVMNGKDGKWGYIRQNCDISDHWSLKIDFIVNPAFEDIGMTFSEDLACVKTDGKWGYISLKTIENKDFSNTLHYGTNRIPIDMTGEYAITPQFDDAYNFHEGLARVMIETEKNPLYDSPYIHWYVKPSKGKWGFIDKTGQFIINPQYDIAGNFIEGLAAVKIDGKFGYIDKNGEFAIKPQFDTVTDFSQGLACVSANGKYGYINKKGEYFIKPLFDDADNFNDGIAIVKINDKCHYITRDSLPKRAWGKRMFFRRLLISIKGFDDAKPYKEGFAAVKKNGKYGYINKKGEYAIKPQFDEAHYFIGKVAPIKQDGKFHYINQKGEIIWTSDEFPYIWLHLHD
ncbi:MAG: WG repeat-containing protein [Bacteroidales bacterium]|nr:WG repeat-containing protein [Bacteroidales bacterium]